MTHFRAQLAALDRRLPLEGPVRDRVLMEVAADLEDMFEHFRGTGLGAEEAAGRAVQACDLSDTALAELVRVHSCGPSRLQDRVAGPGPSRWELLLIVVMGLGVISGVFLQPPAGGIIGDAGPAVWPVLALFAMAVGRAVWALFRRSRARADRAHQAVLMLAVWQFVLGVTGIWIGLYRGVLASRQEITRLGVFLFDWLQGSAALLCVALACTLLSALIWYGLAGRAARRDGAAARSLRPDLQPLTPGSEP